MLREATGPEPHHERRPFRDASGGGAGGQAGRPATRGGEIAGRPPQGGMGSARRRMAGIAIGTVAPSALVPAAPAAALFHDERLAMWQGIGGWAHVVVGGLMPVPHASATVLFCGIMIGLAVPLVRRIAGRAATSRRGIAPGAPEGRAARGEIGREAPEGRRPALLAGRAAGPDG
jgi:hypothetical protein